MSDWLELELAHRLTPVKAPSGLWARVEAGLPLRSVRTLRGPRGVRGVLLALPAAVLASLTLATGALCGVPMPLSAGTLAALSAAIVGDYGDGDIAELPRFFREAMLQNFER